MRQSTKDLYPCLIFYFCSHLRCLFSRLSIQFSAVQLRPTLCDPMDCSTPGFPVHHQLSMILLKLLPIESVMPSNHLYPVIPFSSCLQSFPASGSFPRSQFFTSGGQSIGAPASASVLPMNIQDWFPFGLTGLISLLSKELAKSLLQHHSSKASILQHSACFMVQLSHPYMTTGKTIARWTFVSNVISLLNMLSSPVLLPGKSHGWRSLVGCSPWGCEESDMTERLHFHFSLSCIGEGNGNPLQCSCLENPRDGGAW